jgi:Icc-related predicted phosphoesterase
LKILLTADLHLLRATREQTLGILASWVRQLHPEVMVVAGDIASAPQAAEALLALRRIFSQGWLAICLGNHDFWMHDDARQRYASLDQVVEAHWLPAARRADVVLLDRGNLELPDLYLVGGYGHYDFGFAIPDLAYGDLTISETDYLRGCCPEVSAMRWRDFQLMPAIQADPRDVSAAQVTAFESRLVQTGTKPVLAVTHTAPFQELLGVPRLPVGTPPPARAFFRAYLGNRGMGAMLQRHLHRLCGVVCGHTHRSAGPVSINGVPGVNVGSDYGAPRAVVYEVEESRFWRVPDPLP